MLLYLARNKAKFGSFMKEEARLLYNKETPWHL